MGDVLPMVRMPAVRIMVMAAFAFAIARGAMKSRKQEQEEVQCPEGLEFEAVDGVHGPKDGKIDETELQHRTIVATNIRHMDRNHDGRVSAHEAAKYRKHFRDAHKDSSKDRNDPYSHVSFFDQSNHPP